MKQFTITLLTLALALAICGAVSAEDSLLVLMLKDDGKGEGRWEFPLPAAATKEFINVWPREGASLAEPNVAGDDGPPNLAKLRQVQLMGDWAGGKPLDLEVDAVLLLPPTEGVLAARAEKKKRLAAEEQARHEAQSALLKRYGTRSNKSPTIEHVSAVAADVLAVEIQAGTLVPAALVKYEPQAGDKKQEQKNDAGDVEVLLQRNGKTIGWLIGPNHDWLTPWEEITGDPLLDFIADDPATFSVRSSDDVALQGPATPLAVGRKSHVNAWAQGPGTVAVRHTVYLKLPKRLTPGKSYSLNVGSLNTQQQDVKLDFDPTHIRSEAVHVNQIGYRPDDPVKQAFVSCWLGTGGVLELRTQK